MSEVLIPATGAIAAYVLYRVMSERTRLMEMESMSAMPPAPPGCCYPPDLFTAYVSPSDAMWDTNCLEYTYRVVDPGGCAMDGRMRKDILSGYGRAPTTFTH